VASVEPLPINGSKIVPQPKGMAAYTSCRKNRSNLSEGYGGNLHFTCWCRFTLEDIREWSIIGRSV
jgi:hypothetical protein